MPFQPLPVGQISEGFASGMQRAATTQQGYLLQLSLRAVFQLCSVGERSALFHQVTILVLERAHLPTQAKVPGDSALNRSAASHRGARESLPCMQTQHTPAGYREQK